MKSCPAIELFVLTALAALAALAAPAAARVLADPEHPTFLLYEPAPGRTEPYFHIEKTAYLLLDARVDWRQFVEDARADGFDTLRIFLMVHWLPEDPWAVNPWSRWPGARKIEGDPDMEWWQEFDEAPDGYWCTLEAVLDFMAERGMIANLCLFDHLTLTLLECERPMQGVRFLAPLGTQLDDGRLGAFLDRLTRACRGRENFYFEIGNQISLAWFRPGVAIGEGPCPHKIAPGGDHEPTCARWMASIVERLQRASPRDRPPLVTNSSGYHEDLAFSQVARADWCAAVSIHSNRADDWFMKIYTELAGPPGLNSGLVAQFGKPVIDNEPMPQGRPVLFGYRDPDPAHVRIHSWLTAMGGGHKCYHSEPAIRCTLNRDLAPGGEAGKDHVRHLRRFWVESGLPYRELQPAPAMVTESGGLRTFARASADRRCAVVYMLGDLAAGVAFTLDLPPGDYEARWLEPETGLEARRPIPAERPARIVYPDDFPRHWDAAVRIERLGPAAESPQRTSR